MTLEEYEKLNQQAVKLDEQRKHEEWKYNVENADEIAAKYQREKLKKFRVKDVDEEKKKKEEPSKFAAPDEIASIGSWQVVEARYVLKFSNMIF